MLAVYWNSVMLVITRRAWRPRGERSESIYQLYFTCSCYVSLPSMQFSCSSVESIFDLLGPDRGIRAQSLIENFFQFVRDFGSSWSSHPNHPFSTRFAVFSQIWPPTVKGRFAVCTTVFVCKIPSAWQIGCAMASETGWIQKSLCRFPT